MTKASTFPWGAASVIFLSYVTLGMNLAIHNPGWSLWKYCTTSMLMVGLIVSVGSIIHTWGRGNFLRLVRVGPRSILTMLYLSSIITLAVVSSLIFILILMIGAAAILMRIEMRAAGYQTMQILGVMVLLGLGGMVLGWIAHRLVISNTLQLILNG